MASRTSICVAWCGMGKVAGVRLGRLWFTTAEAVDAYLAKGHRPGPKPKDRTKTQVTSHS